MGAMRVIWRLGIGGAVKRLQPRHPRLENQIVYVSQGRNRRRRSSIRCVIERVNTSVPG